MSRPIGPNDRVPDWKKQTLAQRIQACRLMLAMHGLLTEAEELRVEQRQIGKGLHPGDYLGRDK